MIKKSEGDAMWGGESARSAGGDAVKRVPQTIGGGGGGNTTKPVVRRGGNVKFLGGGKVGKHLPVTKRGYKEGGQASLLAGSGQEM